MEATGFQDFRSRWSLRWTSTTARLIITEAATRKRASLTPFADARRSPLTILEALRCSSRRSTPFTERLRLQ